MTPTQPATSAITRAQQTAVRIQIATPRHRDGLAGFVAALSAESAYRRFFGADPRPTPRMLDLLLCNDAHHVAAVASAGGRVVGHAMLARRGADLCSPEPAELAVVVADSWQHHGIGPNLVRYLLDHAARLVVGGLEFTVLADNLHANAVVQRLWPLATMSRDHGVLYYRVDVGNAQRRPARVRPMVA